MFIVILQWKFAIPNKLFFLLIQLMQRINLVFWLFVMTTTTFTLGNARGPKPALNPALLTYIGAAQADFAKIPADRREALDKIAQFIQQKVNTGQAIQLTYICTHNSRRSHFGQIWGATAAAYYGVPNVSTFSGGTEASAFNERAVAACSRAGFTIAKQSEDKNAVYEVRYATDKQPIKAFSKRYDDPANPQQDFCAVMTCSQADAACPIVKGAVARVAIPYQDPKVADGTPQEQAVYDERCKQIATETLYIFSRVKTKA
jgi:arsenate reductase (thioredoxin)